MALGALILKERLGSSDAETVEQIRENPYLQYFLGLSEYTNQAPFDASMLVHFRKRLSLEIVGHINERIVLNALASSSKTETETTNAGYSKKENKEGEVDVSNNQGQLILNASCAPADIGYPTDLSLLNEAREHTETIIDLLYEQLKEEVEKKPRTYRQQARQEYWKIAKQRKVNQKTRRKAIRKPLGYLRRNLAHIDELLAQAAS
jgi:hypothetical protein